MDFRALAFDVLLALSIPAFAWLLLVFSQGPGIQFVYFAF